MPIYEYVCSACGKLNEAFQKVNDPTPEKCDGCDAAGTLTRALSRTSFVLKGGGWYSDLYGSVKKDKESGTGSSATPSGSSSGGEKKSSDSGTSTSPASSPGSAGSSSPPSSGAGGSGSGSATPSAAK